MKIEFVVNEKDKYAELAPGLERADARPWRWTMGSFSKLFGVGDIEAADETLARKGES